ncbi:hypothetical protein P9112_002459 [Eukaryota sp. TZLM1-RC]
MPNGNNNYCAYQAPLTANSNSAVDTQKMSGVCQTSVRGDPSNPPLNNSSSSSSMATPEKDSSSGEKGLTPPQVTDSRLDTSTASGSGLSPTKNQISAQNVQLNQRGKVTAQGAQYVHSSANTALATTPKVNFDLPPAPSQEIQELLLALTMSKEEMEKKEPTDFIESLDESIYPQQGSHELSTRPAERRMRLSPLDTEYKNIMAKPRTERDDFLGNNATLDNKGFRIRWLEVMEVGTDFSGKLDSPENVRLLPDWFRVGIDKIYEELSAPGEDYTVVREVHEYYPVSHRPNYVEMRPASQPFRLIYEELGVTYRRDDINMTTAVVSTYRSPPNNRNLQTGDSWVQNKVFTFTPIIGLENTAFKSIRPFRPSIQLNFQDESKSVQELHVDTLPQPNTGPIGLDVLTIQPGDSSQPMEGVPQSSVDTTHTTGQGLSLQDLQATGSQQQHSQNLLDPRLILNQNLQSHVGYHYRTKAIEHATIHEPLDSNSLKLR